MTASPQTASAGDVLAEEAVRHGGMHRDADRHRVLVEDHPVGMARGDVGVVVVPESFAAEGAVRGLP